MEHDEIFNLHCKGEFEAVKKEQNDIKESLEEIINLLKGGNTDSPGLIERVRMLEKISSTLRAAVLFVVGAVILGGIDWVWGWIKSRGG